METIHGGQKAVRRKAVECDPFSLDAQTVGVGFVLNIDYEMCQ